MDYEIERQEAIEAGERALYSLKEAHEQLRKARNWGIYDIIGGGFLSSLIKHSKIDNARSCIDRAKYDLQVFNRELRDVSMCLDFDIGDFLTFFDLMDSFFADIMVQSRIADASRKVEDVIYRVYDRYERELKKNNAMDFDDLLLNTVRLFEHDEAVLDQYQRRFRYIMVDEYQDTNHVQYKFVRALAERHRNICVVGDDDQCIYQWRGADISNILDFEKDFPGAKVIKLEQNYRSTGNILAAAHSVIANNRQRKAKKLWTSAGEGQKITYYRAEDEKDEARYIAQEIDRLCTIDRQWKDFAVLYRTNAQSRNFEESLSRRDIPYRVVGGVRYYERKEIKDLVAYMRLVENPDDELSLLRILNEPKRGIGNTTRDKLTALASVRQESLFRTLSDPEVQDGLSAKAGKAVHDLMETLQKYHDERANLLISDIYDGLLNGLYESPGRYEQRRGGQPAREPARVPDGHRGLSERGRRFAAGVSREDRAALRHRQP